MNEREKQVCDLILETLAERIKSQLATDDLEVAYKTIMEAVYIRQQIENPRPAMPKPGTISRPMSPKTQATWKDLVKAQEEKKDPK